MTKTSKIEAIKTELVKLLEPLYLDKIILFGSYAYGTPNEDSDIDIFLLKDVPSENVRKLRLEARKMLRPLIAEQHLGIDIVADSEQRVKDRIRNIKDQFYQEIMSKGEVIYGK